MGEEEAAMDYYIKAVEVREPLEQPLPMVQILNGITYSYLNQGDFSSAFYYMRRALKILDKVEDFRRDGGDPLQPGDALRLWPELSIKQPRSARLS
jgi:hypothetical protein